MYYTMYIQSHVLYNVHVHTVTCTVLCTVHTVTCTVNVQYTYYLSIELHIHVQCSASLSLSESDSLHEDRRSGLIPEMEAEEDKNAPPSNGTPYLSLSSSNYTNHYCMKLEPTFSICSFKFKIYQNQYRNYQNQCIYLP